MKVAKALGASSSGMLAPVVVHPTKHADDVQRQIQMGVERQLGLKLKQSVEAAGRTPKDGDPLEIQEWLQTQ